MITVKKNAIKYKSSDGTMKDSGVLCQVGTFGVNWLNYATNWQSIFDEMDFSSLNELPIFEYGSYFKGNMQYAFRSTKNIETIKIIGSKEIPIKLYSTFYGSDVKIIDLTECSNVFSEIQQSFRYCSALEEIWGVLDITNVSTVNALFFSANLLKEVRFRNQCIKLSLSLANSKDLSDASIESFVNGFADMTGQTAIVFTVHKDVKARIEANPIWLATLTSKNVTLA